MAAIGLHTAAPRPRRRDDVSQLEVTNPGPELTRKQVGPSVSSTGKVVCGCGRRRCPHAHRGRDSLLNETRVGDWVGVGTEARRRTHGGDSSCALCLTICVGIRRSMDRAVVIGFSRGHRALGDRGARPRADGRSRTACHPAGVPILAICEQSTGNGVFGDLASSRAVRIRKVSMMYTAASASGRSQRFSAWRTKRQICAHQSSGGVLRLHEVDVVVSPSKPIRASPPRRRPKRRSQPSTFNTHSGESIGSVGQLPRTTAASRDPVHHRHLRQTERHHPRTRPDRVEHSAAAVCDLERRARQAERWQHPDQLASWPILNTPRAPPTARRARPLSPAQSAETRVRISVMDNPS
jgi:hypothetical protein